MTQFIKAPFNFVPLSEKVVYPDWADQISHDIPFSDGESGEITLKLIAKTPVFVRNGHAKKDSEAAKEFSHYKDENGQKKYFIPGTSIKGMIRNVMEIMTFGKMNLDKNMRFATRDWNNQRIYDLKKITEQQKVRCGYLYKEGDKYFIEDHGTPYRINHKRIDEHIGGNKRIFEKNFSKAHGVDLNKPIQGKDPKSAYFKYSLIKDLPGNLFKNQRFTIDNEFANDNQSQRVKGDPNGELFGDIIFTGQPDKWSSDNQAQRENDKGKGKFYEFVFGSEITGAPLEVSEDMFEQFKFFHSDSEDWQKLWKAKFNTNHGRVPVFFRLDGMFIKDFGLAFLYKTPFKYSVKEIGNKHQKEFDVNRPDFTECIFGFSNKKDNQTKYSKFSKGRVQFGHATAIDNPTKLDLVTTIMGSPKASYYPIYVKQNHGHIGLVETKMDGKKSFYNYTTYQDDNSVPSGWKRYPIKRNLTVRPSDNPNLQTSFYPLAAESTFEQKIRFHNLRPIELGALLAAITFHGNEHTLFHSIGLGKPMGFGKLKVVVLATNKEFDIKKHLSLFEDFMNKELGKSWVQTDQMIELLTMARDIDAIKERELLDYMKMDNNPENNEFLKAKQLGEYLRSYSSLSNSKFKPASISEEWKKLQVSQKKEVFIELIDLLKQNLDHDNLVDSRKLVEEINKLIVDIDSQVLEVEIFIELENEVQLRTKLKEHLDKANEMSRDKNFKEARLILQDKVKPLLRDDQQIADIETRIKELKESESDSISFLSSIDTNVPIENNKGKVQGYLQRKGRIKYLPDRDHEDLFKALLKWREIDPKKNERKWTELKWRNSIWQEYVKHWVPENMITGLFERIINPK